MSFRPLWGSFLFLFKFKQRTYNLCNKVSVPYGDLFYFYDNFLITFDKALGFPSPMGIFFISMVMVYEN